MKRIIFFLASCLPLLSVLAQKTVMNDANVEVRAVRGFHGIEVSNVIDLYLSQGGQETVGVSAAEIKWRDRIRTEVEGGILKIWLDNKGWSWNGGGKKMKGYFFFSSPGKLVASGARDVYVDWGFFGSSPQIMVSCASDF